LYLIYDPIRPVGSARLQLVAILTSFSEVSEYGRKEPNHEGNDSREVVAHRIH